jgi:2'-5' RNA ligase
VLEVIVRCFIAIDLPEELKIRIGDFIDKIHAASEDIRWVPKENIHLTIKFLGEIKEDTLADIGRCLRDVCRIHAPFSISLQGTGAFPNQKSPNVLWIGVKKSLELKNLYMDIEEAMSEIGFEEEDRKHSPHLTIGRVKNRINISPVMKSLDEFKNEFFGIVLIAEVHLMKSILKSSGAQYAKLASFKLKGDLPDKGRDTG